MVAIGVSPARTVLAVASLAASLAGCYVVPTYPDGTVAYPASILATPAVVQPAIVVREPAATTLAARLYPANAVASQRGMAAGTVVDFGNGKGRFVLDYEGERLSGEATRVRGDERRGIASAYGPRGTYMSCDYRMTSPSQGTGSCTLSDGARYTVHLGN